MIIQDTFSYQELTAADVKLHDCSWDEYCQLPGVSFSGLKDKPIMNDGIKIGSLVHKFILKPKEYNQEHADIVRPIANALINFVGHTLINTMTCEKGLTATLIHKGLKLEWKGMPDMFWFKYLVIDFKIIAGSLEYYVERFRYKDQLRGYMFPLQCRQGMIIAYNKSKKRIETYLVVLDDLSFWKDTVLTRGEVLV